jgi:phage host-nuclease inhibitor protein Gam
MGNYNPRVKSDKVNLTAIDDWQQADEIIRTIGDLKLQIIAAEKKAKDDIDEIKVEMLEMTKLLQNSIKQHTTSLEAFAMAQRKDFKDQKSKKLNFGILGWRKSTSIKISKDTLELIKKTFSAAKVKIYVRIKETIDKEQLTKLSDEQLENIEAERLVKNIFFVEPDMPNAVDYTD